MSDVTQEQVITLKLAKNVECIEGKEMTIGNISKRLGGLNKDQEKEMREYGIKIAKQVGIEEPTEIVKEVFNDEEFQKVLGLKSEFCNEYWYIRREYEIAKYFAMKKDVLDDLLEMMAESLKEGIQDSYKKTKVYKMEKTVEELKAYVKDYEAFKKELGL